MSHSAGIDAERPLYPTDRYLAKAEVINAAQKQPGERRAPKDVRKPEFATEQRYEIDGVDVQVLDVLARVFEKYMVPYLMTRDEAV
jgi:hypothetical protein